MNHAVTLAALAIVSLLPHASAGSHERGAPRADDAPHLGDGAGREQPIGQFRRERPRSAPLVGGVLWNNDLESNGFNAQPTSPPQFPEFRVADDFRVPPEDQAGWAIEGLNVAVVEDPGWIPGNVMEIVFYIPAGECPLEPFEIAQVPFERQPTGRQLFGRDEYIYFAHFPPIVVPPGQYHIGFSIPDAGGNGTTYWTTSNGGEGADQPGCVSVDFGNSWNSEGPDWNHSFEITGFLVSDPLLEPPCTECKEAAKVAPCDCEQSNCGPAVSLGDPVYLFSGEAYETGTDLDVSGLGFDFTWARKYRSRVACDSAQGRGWDFSYNIHLTPVGSSFLLHDGNARRDLYVFNPPDNNWTTDGFYRTLEQEQDGSFTLTLPDTSTMTFLPFDGNPAQGKVSTLRDRNGNAQTVGYDGNGQVITIIDTLDRQYDVTRNVDGLIEFVTEIDGLNRQVTYDYYEDGDEAGSAGDLKSVTTPAVVGTPHNDFPNGKTTTYTYTTGFGDERLNHDLLTITDPKGQTYLQNVYAHTIDAKDFRFTLDPNDLYFDRVVRQIWGDPGDVIDYVYVPIAPDEENNFSILKTIVNDRVGNVMEYFFDSDNRIVRTLQYTGRAPDADAPTTEVDNRPVGKLRPAHDPDFFESLYDYNDDSRLTLVIDPNGNSETFVYDAANESRRSQGNLLEHCRIPGVLGGDQDEICELFEYDEDFGGCCGTNFVTRHTDARGNDTLHEYDDNGNRLQTQHRIPSIVEDFEYGGIGGQMSAHVWPDNGSGHRRRDELFYYNAGPQRGYLNGSVLDVNFEALTTTYEYDDVGNMTRTVDPRGHDTIYQINQLDQIVREISRETTDGSGIRYERVTYYDANDNVVRVDVENLDENGDVPDGNTHFTTVYEYEILNRVTRRCAETGIFIGDPPGPHDQPTCDGLPEDEFITVEFEYDANRNQTLVRQGESTNGNQPDNVVQTLYDERDLLFREIRAPGAPDQATIQVDYDGNRNSVREIGGLEADGDPKYPGDGAHVTERIYDGYDRLTRATDPMGNVTEFHYDPNGNVGGDKTEGMPNEFGELRVGELIDLEGDDDNIRLFETTYVYDSMDRRTRTITDFFDTETQTDIGDGKATTETTWTDNSQIIIVTNDNAHSTTSTYDTMNRLSIIVDPKGNTRTREYDDNSNVIRIIEDDKSDLIDEDDQSFTTTYVYDNLDRLIRVIDNVDNETDSAYDSRHNLVFDVDPLGTETRTRYDGINRLIQSIHDMDGDGADGDGDDIVTSQTWDDSSRLIARTDGEGNVTRNAYDALDRLVAVRMPDRTIYQVGNGLLEGDWPDGEPRPDLSNFTNGYDTHGNGFHVEDPNGSVVDSEYDLNDRLDRKDIAPGGGVSNDTTFEIYRYDGLSRMVRAEDDDSVVTQSYDSLSRATRETLDVAGSGPLTTECLFDGVGNELTSTYPGGRIITCTYDELERKKTVTDQGGDIARYDYIGPSRVLRREYGNGTRTDYAYDGVTGVPNPPGDAGERQIIETRHSRIIDGLIIDRRTYLWDGLYNKIERKDLRDDGPELTHTYVYDAIYRLRRTIVTDADAGTVRDETYDHDKANNRAQVTGGEDPGLYFLDPTLPEPADKQVNQYTVTPFDARQYDRNGNLIAVDSDDPPPAADVTYDYRNQMVRYDDPDAGLTTRYAYDPMGRRIQRIVDAGDPETTRYYYDGWQVCEERDELGAERATYAYGLYLDEVLTTRRQERDYYYHADDLYSVMALTGPTEQWRDDFDDYPVGPLVGQGGWIAFNEDPERDDFDVTDERFRSAPNSLVTDGPDDALRPFEGFDSGVWQCRAWVYVSAAMDDQQWFILLNRYPTAFPAGWSTALRLDGDLGVVLDLGTDETLPLVRDRWVEIRVEIDLDNDVQSIFYDGQHLVTKIWSEGVGGEGDTSIAAVNLWGADSAHPVWWDDLRLEKIDVVERYEYGDYGRPTIYDDGSCPADVNGDSVVNFDDLLLVLSAWGPCPEEGPCPEDISGDNEVGFDDLLLVLSTWGPCPEALGIGNPYRFTGRRYDPETGWYYYRTRYLDPDAGRFTTRDTIGAWGDPINIGNAYGYVGNNPATWLDPMGLYKVVSGFGAEGMLGGLLDEFEAWLVLECGPNCVVKDARTGQSSFTILLSVDITFSAIRDYTYDCPNGSKVNCKRVDVTVKVSALKLAQVSSGSRTLTACCCSCPGGGATPGSIPPKGTSISDWIDDAPTGILGTLFGVGEERRGGKDAVICD